MTITYLPSRLAPAFSSSSPEIPFLLSSAALFLTVSPLTPHETDPVYSTLVLLPTFAGLTTLRLTLMTVETVRTTHGNDAHARAHDTRHPLTMPYQLPPWLSWYKKPEYRDFREYATHISSGRRPVSPNGSIGGGIPHRLRLDRILANKTCMSS